VSSSLTLQSFEWSMANSYNRTRVIYFRVSEVEFQRLRDLCQRSGVRNMSDLARSAIELLARHNGNSFEHEVRERLQQMESSLHEIRAAINTGQV
jgi:hypothetical protein